MKEKFMLQTNIQPINAADLPPEEFRFIKAQQTIYNLCSAIQQDDALKYQLKNAETPQYFLEIAANNGYKFNFSDLKDALQLALEEPKLNSDEFDDYELSEEDLEMVAGGGGTAVVRSMSRYSYWHETGVITDNQCFYLSYQSSEGREILKQAMLYMEKWEWLGNGQVQVTDTDGNNDGRTSYILNDLVYNGSVSSDYIASLDPTKFEIF